MTTGSRTALGTTSRSTFRHVSLVPTGSGTGEPRLDREPRHGTGKKPCQWLAIEGGSWFQPFIGNRNQLGDEGPAASPAFIDPETHPLLRAPSATRRPAAPLCPLALAALLAADGSREATPDVATERAQRAGHGAGRRVECVCAALRSRPRHAHSGTVSHSRPFRHGGPRLQECSPGHFCTLCMGHLSPRRILARVLRAVADELESAAGEQPPEAREPGAALLEYDHGVHVGPQMALARQLSDEARLRDALRRSLRRYSPEEPPGEA